MTLKVISRSFFRLLDLVVPKNPWLWVFGNASGKYWGGNLRAVFEVARNDPRISTVIINRGPCENSSISDLYPGRTKMISPKSLMGIWLTLRCGVALITHGTGDLDWLCISKRRRIINLWHGVPLKRIGFLVTPQDSNRSQWLLREANKYTTMICSSACDRLAMSTCFNLLPWRVWETGLPRNDWLLCEDQDLPEDLRNLEIELKERLNGRRLVLYAPTYRSNGKAPFPFKDSELADFTAMLRRSNTALGIRFHINTRLFPRIPSNPDVIDLSLDRYPETQVLLRNTDVLVTDYSSLWVDFLLLQRPIIGFVCDWDDYIKDRGFLYEYESIFPGPLVRDSASLQKAIRDSFTGVEPSYMPILRRKALGLFHTYVDNRASLRVVRAIKELTNGCTS